MRIIQVIQRLSPCLCVDRNDYIPDAKPGMLLIDKELHKEIIFTVETSDVVWIKFPDVEKPVLYLVRVGGDGLVVRQRPLSAQMTGELEVGKTYLLTSELCTYGDQTFYCLAAKEHA